SDDRGDGGSAKNLGLLVQRRGETFSLAADVGAKAMPADPLALADPLDESLIARLGIFCIEVDQRVVEPMPGLRTHYGLVVAAMLAESRAETLDLKPGDIIHEINSLPVATLNAFRTSLNQFQKGDAIALQIERAGRYRYTAFEIE